MPLRILVVVDHAPFRRLICTELRRRAEFQTIEAGDGLEAVQEAEELQPDLILLDINLPKLHGFEVAKQIPSLAPHEREVRVTRDEPGEPAVAADVTGLTQAEEIRRGMRRS